MYKDGKTAIGEPDCFLPHNQTIESSRHKPPKGKSQIWDLATWKPPKYDPEDKPEWAKYRSKVLQMVIALNQPSLRSFPLGFTQRTAEVVEQVQKMRRKYRIRLGVPSDVNALSDPVLRSLDDWAFRQQKTSLPWAWIEQEDENPPKALKEEPMLKPNPKDDPILERSKLLAAVEKSGQVRRETDKEILEAVKGERQVLSEIQKRRLKPVPGMPLRDIEAPKQAIEEKRKLREKECKGQRRLKAEKKMKKAAKR